MSYWKLIAKTYLYDGTLDGFLSLVFDCFSSKTLPQKIHAKSYYVPNFLEKTIYIDSDDQKASRIFQGIEKNIGYLALENTYYAFLCNQKEKENNLLKYLCDGFQKGPKINTLLTIPYVYQVMAMKKKSVRECHRLKGLVRFQEMNENLFYSSIHPDHNILEPLGQHFKNRLPHQNFILEDKNRNLFFLYNTKEYRIEDSSSFFLPPLSQKELYYQALWKAFYSTISIKERKNRRCQMQFMPKKYWQDLIENPNS